MTYPRYFLREGGGSRPQLFRVDETQTQPLIPWHLSSPIPTTPDNQIWDINAASDWRKDQFIEPILPPGRFYPRMARPFHYGEPFGCPVSEEDQNYISEALGQLGVFCRELESICRTVHPVTVNFGTYGHDIRNLLILACTEVEAHWKGVLRLNGKRGRTTKDYVLLHKPMKLEFYKVNFLNYRWLPTFSPFISWGNSQTATADLPWYKAYNSVKHDREAEFAQATLEQLLNALAACAIMMVAQFGLAGLGYQAPNARGLLDYFDFNEVPEWTLAEHYIDYLDGLPNYCSENYPW